MTKRTGKVVYEHAFEHADGRFIDFEVRKTAAWKREGRIDDPTPTEDNWQLIEKVNLDTLFSAYKRIRDAILGDGFEVVYRLDPSESYRRFQHPETGQIFEIDLDAAAVIKRSYQPGERARWEVVEFDWDQPAEESYEEELAAAKEAGMQLVEERTLLQYMRERMGPLPEAYDAFLSAGRHEELTNLGLRTLPTFRHWVWVDFTHRDIPWPGEEAGETLVIISGPLRDAPDRSIDPHPVRLAIDRKSGAIVLCGDGAVLPAYDSLDAMVQALEPQ